MFAVLEPIGSIARRSASQLLHSAYRRAVNSSSQGGRTTRKEQTPVATGTGCPLSPWCRERNVGARIAWTSRADRAKWHKDVLIASVSERSGYSPMVTRMERL